MNPTRFKLHQLRANTTATVLSLLLTSATYTAIASESTVVGQTSSYAHLTYDQHPLDEIFRQLRQASAKNDAALAASLADQLSDYPLTSYVAYYRLKPQLYNSDGTGNPSAPTDEIEAFISQYRGQALADRMRNDYLHVLAARQDWQRFMTVNAQFELKDDIAIKCYEQIGKLELQSTTTNEVLKTAKQLYFDGKAASNKACQQLSTRLMQSGISAQDEQDLIAITAFGSSAAGQNLAAQARSANNPFATAAIVSQLSKDNGSPYGEGFNNQQTALAYAYYGYSLIRNTRQGAASAFRTAYQNYPDLQLPDDVLGWQARAGMRELDWDLVGKAIDKMTATERDTSIWHYWRARAYEATGQSSQARDHYMHAALSNGGYDFYGILAREALHQSVQLPRPYLPTESEVDRASKTDGFNRARKFAAMNMTMELSREWNYPLRQMNDNQLIATAEYARRVGLLDRMINTSDRSKGLFNFNQRYPTPYLYTVQNYAGQAGIPAAWAYGITRQESRFVTLAKSSANANGLMQIIPETAKATARRIGMTNFTLDQLTDINVNVQLGTAYLAQVRDELYGSMSLASAGYNAGPGRPRQWRTTLIAPVDGMIFAETIPFAETRGYVKNVMANTYLYYLTIGERPPRLTDMMGTVSP